MEDGLDDPVLARRLHREGIGRTLEREMVGGEPADVHLATAHELDGPGIDVPHTPGELDRQALAAGQRGRERVTVALGNADQHAAAADPRRLGRELEGFRHGPSPRARDRRRGRR